jgi:hypothetical protein
VFIQAVDRFRESENSILVATDGFARGMDFDNVRTVIHYQLPHSSDVGALFISLTYTYLTLRPKSITRFLQSCLPLLGLYPQEWKDSA